MHHTHATFTLTTPPPPPLPRSWVSDYVPPVRLSPRAQVTDPVESQHEIEVDDGEEVQS